MALEEQAAYALASWARFDAAMSDDLLRAVTSAFALVAVADGDLAASELDRFMQMLREHAYALSPLDFEQVDRLFRDICGALLSDPAAGRRRALEAVAAVRGNPVHRELVRSAAEIAVVADTRELIVERDVLREIHEALDIPPR
jgi:tellurite resistance protein